MKVYLLIRRRSPGSLARMMVLVLATALLGCVPQAANAESGLSTELGASAEPGAISSTPSTTQRYTPCPSSADMVAECNLVIDPVPIATTSGYELPDGSPLLGSGEKGGLDPENLESAYKIPTTGGSSETVALVDAYGDSTAESDLNKYREKYKVYYKGTETACTKTNGCFKKVNVKGEEANYPAAGPEIWGAETALDIEMVSAACPECHILLVEASGEYPAETAAAVEEAAKLKATEISNSYGYSEDDESACPSKKGCKEYLAAYNQGIPVMASAGDGGYDNKNRGYSAPLWPAVSPNVIAVGGTELEKVEKPKEGERGWKEVVWPDSGSGCSLYESEPTWQEAKTVPKACGADRTDNDVASVAEEVSIYTTPYEGGWGNVGGTSASSPFVAGVEAHATSATKKLGADAFYKKPSMLFHISSGSNGSCGAEGSETYYLCHATKEGYNGPTGMGTPDGVFTSTAAPTVTTGSATGVKQTEATVHGTVNPEGLETKYYFEYGTAEPWWTEQTSYPITGASGIAALQCGGGYYGGRCVAVTSSGTVYTDYEPTTTAWAKQTSYPITGASGIAALQCEDGYTYGQCVAVTSSGTVYTDKNPTTTAWTEQTSYPITGASGIVALECFAGYEGGDCVAVTSSGAVYTDKNPTTTAWTKQTSYPITGASNIVALQCNYGYYEGDCVAVTSSGAVYTDKNPTTTAWTEQTSYPITGASGIVALQCVFGYARGECVAVTSSGAVYSDKNPTTTAWTKQTSYPITGASGIAALDCDNGYEGDDCVAVTSSGAVYTDADPATTASKTAEASAGSGTSSVEESKTITGLTSGTVYHYRIVATNSTGTTYGAEQAFSTLDYSITGASGIVALECFAGYEGGDCVAVTSSGAVYTDKNPTTTAWTKQTSYPITGASNIVALQCNYGYYEGDCVAVTSSGAVYTDKNPTTTAWTEQTSYPITGASGIVALQCVFGYARGECVAVTSSGAVYTDKNPTTTAWTEQTSYPITGASGIAALDCDNGYEGDDCVAVTSSGAVYTDENPTTTAWTKQTSYPITGASGIAALQCGGGYYGGRCVAVTSSGTVYTDYEPTTTAWTEQTSYPITGASGIAALQCEDGYTYGQCVAVTSSGAVYTDKNPTTTTWTE